MNDHSPLKLRKRLQETFHHAWSELAQALSFQTSGLYTFQSWCESKSWGKQIGLDDNESSILFSIFLLHSFTQVRQQMINMGTYSFKKKKLENYIREQMNVSELPFEHIYSEWLALYTEDKRFVEQFSPYIFHQNLKSFQQLQTKDQLDHWLYTWISRPHLKKYVDLYESMNNEELINDLRSQALQLLKTRQLHDDASQRVYMQLLCYHKEVDKGVHFFLLRVKDPLKIGIEGEQLLQMLKTESAPSAKKVMIQFIERLIEKKTKNHYEKASTFLTELQNLCKEKNELKDFYTIVQILKKRYSRYTSLQQELKRFDS
ncbi:hypothetical protein LGQ02_14250 [Bacillus shivajii]|uniref:hypothetical protein n=1 Tax=Bacillus shivajii TaxID=1983719 RepID=UPI001CFAAC85|nr:hypothetical protein [Bacillus shivajii]UCZ52007.1 hypothetical protein LGQ02_14250 [Bacillus shivajii]